MHAVHTASLYMTVLVYLDHASYIASLSIRPPHMLLHEGQIHRDSDFEDQASPQCS